MPKSFDFSIPPFDRLVGPEVTRVIDSLDIGFFPAGTTIIRAGETPDHLYVVIKGYIEERQGDEVVAMMRPNDAFDSRALTHGSTGTSFVVREEALCYMLPREVLFELIRGNPAFGAYLYQDISAKLDAFASRQGNRELNQLMLARVNQAYIHPAVSVDASASLRDAGHRMEEAHVNALLVRDGERIGIVTGMNLAKAVILKDQPVTAPVGAIAHFEPVTVRADDFLYNALILMTKHSLRRVVVSDGDGFIGVLDEIDLLSFLSNHSHIVAMQVERATTENELRLASNNVMNSIQILHNSGVKIHFITQLVTQLHRKIFAKLYSMVAPPELREDACLIVMGSEGRGEQIMKSDQDNAVIFRHDLPVKVVDRFRHDFTHALLDFGYPRCEGDIMVSNPAWSKSLADFKRSLHSWILTPDEWSPLNLAIFYDAVAVAGDAKLLDDAKIYMFGLLSDNNPFYSRFAKAIDTFSTPLGMFHNLVVEKGQRHKDTLEIKKGGIFPIVHGVRSLALEHRLKTTNTSERIRDLRDKGIFDNTFAMELIEAFNFLLGLQLRNKLAQIAVDQPTDNFIRPDDLSTLERDVLRDSLYVVKRFKEFVRYHFRLSMF